MSDRPLLTPFHARTTAANRHSAWTTRNGTTVALRYDDVAEEALAARFNVALADISWRWRITLEGAGSAAFSSRLVTRNAKALTPGSAFKALWLADGGGVRGAGVIARFGEERFQLIATLPDREWIEAAARSFGVRCSALPGGGLAVVGPCARPMIQAAGLPAEIAPLANCTVSWRGLDITISRWGEHGGYEIWCDADDGVLLWDRLMQAGAPFALMPAGTAAMDVLDLEAGIARPGLDYRPAREARSREPSPATLGLASLIDFDHTEFNGRRAILTHDAGVASAFVGIEIDSEEPAPFTPLTLKGATVGHTLRSAYSPVLRCAIALAILDARTSEHGTTLDLALPPSFSTPSSRTVPAKIVPLPFLAPVAQIGESNARGVPIPTG